MTDRDDDVMLKSLVNFCKNIGVCDVNLAHGDDSCPHPTIKGQIVPVSIITFDDEPVAQLFLYKVNCVICKQLLASFKVIIAPN